MKASGWCWYGGTTVYYKSQITVRTSIITASKKTAACKKSTGSTMVNAYTTYTASHKNSSENGRAYLSTSYKVE